MAKKIGPSSSEDLLQTLEDFTSKKNWDKFFSIRGSNDSFEWYAEWPQLRDRLLPQLPHSSATPPPQILVPGCGSSRLSEHLYDAGYHGITNIDFSKVVISDMLRRNIRSRPEMRWRVMDMTAMQLMKESFDAVLDKGGLDALMEPKLGSALGSQYLSEVKRVLKSGGRFICLTLGEAHVLGLLFSKFRFGWKMTLHAVPQKSNKKCDFQTFMAVVENDSSCVSQQIMTYFDQNSLECDNNQACGFYEALESENKIREEFASGSDILYSLEELQLGIKGNLRELTQGRRIQLTMGECGASRYRYRAVLLDAQEQSDTFAYHCGVFLVPKCRAHEWLFSSEEGQWIVVRSSNTARLIMVLLDSSHANLSMEDIQKDLSPLIRRLGPGTDDNDAQIPFMIASDGIKQRRIVHKVTSALTGPIVVEDVVYEKLDGDNIHLAASNDPVFRRLTFQRSKSLVQSEALLVRKGPSLNLIDEGKKKPILSSKSKKRANQQRRDAQSSPIGETRNKVDVDHYYLASSYHTGIVSGFTLISSYLDNLAAAGRVIKAVVIGLGAGLLPMFLHGCMPFLEIEVVELDPEVLEVARDYFGFSEDNRLKVHVADGLQFVRKAVNSVTCCGAVSQKHDISNGNCGASSPEDEVARKFDILVIDVDSSDASSGLTCPAAAFVEDSFLLTVKDALSEQGLFVINLASRSPVIKDTVILRMKAVFSHLFCLQLEEDVNDVLFALNVDVCLEEDQFVKATDRLEKLLKFGQAERNSSIMSAAKKINRLK